MKGPVLVTGAGGLLGGQTAWTFANRGVDAYAFNHGTLDVTDADAVRRVVTETVPAVVIHCAAMTNVDACEQEPERARLVNVDGSRNVAEAAAEVGAAVVAVSTDYVFDGQGGAPYAEFDATNPIQVYGRSKLEGEDAVREANPKHFIVRSAWIYGPGGKNFLSKLPTYAQTTDSVNAIADQFSSPTSAADLAEAIVDLVQTDAYGTYHIVNEGRCSFADFIDLEVRLLFSDLKVDRVSVTDLGLPAPRPRDTALAGEAWKAAGFAPLRPWQEAAADFIGSLP